MSRQPSPQACRSRAFFFFQAEDGIRDHCVTGVQTCALPIFPAHPSPGRNERQFVEHDIFGNTSFRNYLNLLVDNIDTKRQRFSVALWGERLSLKSHLARISLTDSGDDFHQRALASTILAH